jgi:hypothetical protein
MREWKARKISHKGEVYYDVASTARLLRTTAAKVQHLMGEGELEWTQLRRGGKRQRLEHSREVSRGPLRQTNISKYRKAMPRRLRTLIAMQEGGVRHKGGLV